VILIAITVWLVMAIAKFQVWLVMAIAKFLVAHLHMPFLSLVACIHTMGSEIASYWKEAHKEPAMYVRDALLIASIIVLVKAIVKAISPKKYQDFVRWLVGYVLVNLLVMLARLSGLPTRLTRDAKYFRRFFALFVPFPKDAFEELPTDGTYNYSLVNVCDTEFFIGGLPYDDAEGLFSGEKGFDDANNVHFASLCAKLAYEHCDVVKAIVKKWGGWTFDGVFLSPKCGEDEVPYETAAYLISNANCHLVIFRGTMPFSLIQWWTDAQVTWEVVRLQEGTEGEVVYVHKGFKDALEGRSGSQKPSVRELLNAKLRELATPEALAKTEGDNPKPKHIFITGHSLGGALASVYAHSLTLQDEELKDRVKGICTFGQPRVGGESYIARFNRFFGEICLRYVNDSDIVTRLPLMDWGYKHHKSKRFISGMTRETIADRQEIEREHSYYSNWILVWLVWFHKLQCSLLSESFFRIVTRVFIWNCVCDHFPCDYERALRKAIRKKVIGLLSDYVRDLTNANIIQLMQWFKGV